MLDLVALRRQLTSTLVQLVSAVTSETYPAACDASSRECSRTECEGTPSGVELRGNHAVLVDALCQRAVEKILLLLLESIAADPKTPSPVVVQGQRSAGGSINPEQPSGAPRWLLVSLHGSVCGQSGVSAPQVLPSDHEYARPSSSWPSTGGRGGPKPPRQPALRCPRCRKLFPSTERLAEHQRRWHRPCSLCGAAFHGVLKLRRHQLEKHGLPAFGCDFCPKRFNHKTHRDLHVRARHTGEKTHRCDVCGKAYAGAGVLKAHRVTHFPKTFVCDACGRSFFHASHLTRHKMVHRDPPPFACGVCGKRFAQADDLRGHRLTHAADRQLCSVCGKRYRRLRSHVLRKHSGERAGGGASDRPGV